MNISLGCVTNHRTKTFLYTEVWIIEAVDKAAISFDARLAI